MNENHTLPFKPAPPPLDVSVKIMLTKQDGNTLAFATVTLGGCFAVRGIRVMNSKKGVFVAMPSRQGSRGENIDVCFPTTTAMRQVLHTAVLSEYQQTMEQLTARSEKTRGSVLNAIQNARKTGADRPVPDKNKAPQQRKVGKGNR